MSRNRDYILVIMLPNYLNNSIKLNYKYRINAISHMFLITEQSQNKGDNVHDRTKECEKVIELKGIFSFSSIRSTNSDCRKNTSITKSSV